MLRNMVVTFFRCVDCASHHAYFLTSVLDTAWAVNRFLLYKRIALCRFFRVDTENMGRVEILDRILTGLVVAISSLVLLDWMSIKMGKAMTGLFAFGSAGTLALTLASRDLVTQLLSGLFLIFSDKMYVSRSFLLIITIFDLATDSFLLLSGTSEITSSLEMGRQEKLSKLAGWRHNCEVPTT